MQPLLKALKKKILKMNEYKMNDFHKTQVLNPVFPKFRF